MTPVTFSPFLSTEPKNKEVPPSALFWLFLWQLTHRREQWPREGIALPAPQGPTLSGLPWLRTGRLALGARPSSWRGACFAALEAWECSHALSTGFLFAPPCLRLAPRTPRQSSAVRAGILLPLTQGLSGVT